MNTQEKNMLNSTISIFLLPTLIGLLAYSSGLLISIENYKREFKSDVFQQLDKQISSATSLLTELSLQINDCTTTDMTLMREAEFYDLNTRIIGWGSDGQVTCSSDLMLNATLKTLPETISSHQYRVNVELKEIILPNLNSQLVLVLDDDERNWFAVLEPWLLLLKNQCSGCSYVDIGKKGEQASRHHFYLGDIFFDIAFNDKKIEQYVKLPTIKMSMMFASLSFFFIVTMHLYQLASSNSPEHQLRMAIENQEIVPYFQLIFDPRTGKASACEVLARWERKNNTMMPNEFIPLAESTGCIDELVLSLIKQTLETLEEHHSQLEGIVFGFNIAPSQLERPRFVRDLSDLIRTFPPHCIAFEITEREPFKNIDKAKTTIQHFQRLGVIFELDDAGTGYGSFSYVQELDFTLLKIDKMFVNTIGKDDLKRSVLEGIISFCRKTKVSMIAEGVETKEQVDFLVSQGVYLHQGYYFHKPKDKASLLNDMS